MHEVLVHADPVDAGLQGQAHQLVAQVAVEAGHVHRLAGDMGRGRLAAHPAVVHQAAHAAGDGQGPADGFAHLLQNGHQAPIDVGRAAAALAGKLAAAEVLGQIAHGDLPCRMVQRGAAGSGCRAAPFRGVFEKLGRRRLGAPPRALDRRTGSAVRLVDGGRLLVLRGFSAGSCQGLAGGVGRQWSKSG